MTSKYSSQTTKEISALIKKLTQEVPQTSNAEEYYKFLERTLKNASTFDKSSPTYVDYVAKKLKQQEPPKKYIPKARGALVFGPTTLTPPITLKRELEITNQSKEDDESQKKKRKVSEKKASKWDCLPV